ncbi:MAG TPA: cobalt ECF transporter T component CbiQ [Bacteroidales bacterium]|jgi:cobalt ECF transporter T component CbiQ|nr:cobalt ECF transporter T component CbiQ [Bacteroidales bacterium]HNZ42987.1 cobalt ECF transporter T component CbiQ [Bacteroidales bacterium]HOH83368.1 cobalt ECF transporter T component CbiQ [Bacteroidales bacterium]HPB25674.1 cobalt ECF transporter T component CbiQ [Bacteroidales bacterium]HPI30341.1 cobalt ECF transporter T component CbiQ [Bacteroidales bacterium]
MDNSTPEFLLKPEVPVTNQTPGHKSGFGFIDRTLKATAKAMNTVYYQANNSSKPTFTGKLHPATKLFSLIYIIVIISIVNSPAAQGIISGMLFLCFVFSSFNLVKTYKRLLVFGFFFGFIVVVPAAFNIITPGKTLWHLFSFPKEYRLWIYHVPQNIDVTEEGALLVLRFFFRVFNSISITYLVVFSTPFAELIKSLKTLFIPDTFLMVIMLAYKYILILSLSIEETYFAMRSRLLGHVRNKNIRILIAGRIHYIFRRSKQTYELTYLAMVSRGYTGKIVLGRPQKIIYTDIIVLTIVVAFGITISFI